MTAKENIQYLLKHFISGRYDINVFCDLFIEYHREMEEEGMLGEEEDWLNELSDMCYRFSDVAEDLAIEHVYVGEEQIRRYLAHIPESLL